MILRLEVELLVVEFNPDKIGLPRIWSGYRPDIWTSNQNPSAARLSWRWGHKDRWGAIVEIANDRVLFIDQSHRRIRILTKDNVDITPPSTPAEKRARQQGP